jgi:hypothetical protein
MVWPGGVRHGFSSRVVFESPGGLHLGVTKLEKSNVIVESAPLDGDENGQSQE